MAIRFHKGAFEVRVYDASIGRKRYIGRFATRDEAEVVQERARARFGALPHSTDWFERFRALEADTSLTDADDVAVYFIQGASGGPIKIGISVDPPARLATLQASSPVKLRICATMPGGRARERELHLRFRDHRLWGEWFAPCPELLELAQATKSDERHLVALELLQRHNATLADRVAELEHSIAVATSALNVMPPLSLNREHGEDHEQARQ